MPLVALNPSPSTGCPNCPGDAKAEFRLSSLQVVVKVLSRLGVAPGDHGLGLAVRDRMGVDEGDALLKQGAVALAVVCVIAATLGNLGLNLLA
jgi:hypothetical protein